MATTYIIVINVSSVSNWRHCFLFEKKNLNLDRQTEDARGVSRPGFFGLSRPEPDERHVQTVQRRRHKVLGCDPRIHDNWMHICVILLSQSPGLRRASVAPLRHRLQRLREALVWSTARRRVVRNDGLPLQGGWLQMCIRDRLYVIHNIIYIKLSTKERK